MALLLIAAKVGLLTSKKVRWLLIVAFLAASVVWIRRGAYLLEDDESPDHGRVEQGPE
jgi:hypothetical protein